MSDAILTDPDELTPRSPRPAEPGVRDKYSLSPVFGLDVTAEEAKEDEILGVVFEAQQLVTITEAEAARLRAIDEDTRWGDIPGEGSHRSELRTARAVPILTSANATAAKIRAAAQKLADADTYQPPAAPLVFTPALQELASAMRGMPRPKRNDLIRRNADARRLALELDPVITGTDPEGVMLARETSIPPEVRQRHADKRRRQVRALYAADKAVQGVLGIMRAAADPELVAQAGVEKRRSQMSDAERLEVIRAKGLAHYQSLPR